MYMYIFPLFLLSSAHMCEGTVVGFVCLFVCLCLNSLVVSLFVKMTQPT